MIYNLYQINFTDDQVREINRAVNKGETPSWYAKYLKTTFSPTPEAIIEADKDGLYKLVASVEADGLEDVFRIGNIGPEEKIRRYAPMHSVSVGDIVVDVRTDKSYFVDTFGFKEIA